MKIEKTKQNNNNNNNNNEKKKLDKIFSLLVYILPTSLKRNA